MFCALRVNYRRVAHLLTTLQQVMKRLEYPMANPDTAKLVRVRCSADLRRVRHFDLPVAVVSARH